MTTVFDANLIPIIVALLVGVVIAWWVFKRRPDARSGIEAERSKTTQAAPLARATDEVPVNISAEPEPVAAVFPAPGEAAGPPDNLQTLKGVGPKLADRLNQLGITRFDQLARLAANEVDILDDQLGPFKGRVARDRLVEQAGYLARGDTGGFQAHFGNLGSGTL